MHKVMIVDDEILILNGLKNILDWDKLNLTIHSTALNGREALEKFKEEPVDIVITDITMPEMNGLELIKEIKEINHDIKFIILSGYDEFNYAKQAITLGIENYILKPIDEEELESTLINTIKKLESNMQKLLSDKNLGMLRENILFRWVDNNISSYELEERSFILGINLKMPYYQVGIMKLAGSSDYVKKYSQIYDYIRDCSRCLSESAVFYDMGKNIVCICGTNDIDGMENDFKNFLKDIMTNIKEKFNEDIFITLGRPEMESKNAYKSYRSAKELQEYSIITGYNEIISYDKECSKEYRKNEEERININDFNKVLISKDINSVSKYIDELFNNICSSMDATPEDVQNICIKMLMTINKIKNELYTAGDKEEESLKKIFSDVCRLNTTEELKTMIKEKCTNLIDEMNNNAFGLSPIIRQILSFIKNNFHEEISLKTLGYKFNINPSYLGQVFYNEVGESFSDYINKMRNEKAKDMILNTNLKINEIAQKVGYTDTSYFYRKFKAYFGVSPNQLRINKIY